MAFPLADLVPQIPSLMTSIFQNESSIDQMASSQIFHVVHPQTIFLTQAPLSGFAGVQTCAASTDPTLAQCGTPLEAGQSLATFDYQMVPSGKLRVCAIENGH